MRLEATLNNIAWEIAERGIDEATLRPVIALAGRLHIVGVAAQVLADPTAPYIARCRAFAQVARAIRLAVETSEAFSLAA